VDVAGTFSFKFVMHESSSLDKSVERQSINYGISSTLSSNVNGLKVGCFSLHNTSPINEQLYRRDPSQHASLKNDIEAQSTALYSTARLWDDGIIKPTDTRDVVGLGLALAARERRGLGGNKANSTTWDGDGKGFGVFRM
jgi:hypothetical protein